MRYRAVISAFLAASLLTATACKNGFENYLGKARSLGESGDDAGAAALIEKGLLEAASMISSGPPYPACNGGVLFRSKGGRIELLHPFNLTLDGPEDARSVCHDVKTGIIAAGGKGLVIYSGRGKVLDIPDISASRDGVVRACAWTGGSLLFYSEGRLYTYAPSTGEVSPLCPGEKFPPPFAGQFYTASIEVSGTLAVITAGIAGRYNVSAVNLKGGTVLFRNRDAAAGRVFTDGKDILTVTGSAGRWRISVLSSSGAIIRTPLTFTELGNIAFFTGGILYENEKGLWCAAAGRTSPVRVPGSLRLYGQCGGHALIMKGGTLYTADGGATIANITRGREAAPALFTQ